MLQSIAAPRVKNRTNYGRPCCPQGTQAHQIRAIKSPIVSPIVLDRMSNRGRLQVLRLNRPRCQAHCGTQRGDLPVAFLLPMPSFPRYSTPSNGARGHTSSPCASTCLKPNIRSFRSLAREKFMPELHRLLCTGIPVYRSAGTLSSMWSAATSVCRYAVLRLTGVPVDRHSTDMPYRNAMRLSSRKSRPSLINEANSIPCYRYTGLPVYRYIHAMSVDRGQDK